MTMNFKVEEGDKEKEIVADDELEEEYEEELQDEKINLKTWKKLLK